ncbi:MAG TPA: amidohydrolase family protein, partial [Ilumatobacteraceae bacterium]|nr:amidohydrolase family protein [Ilumatobacteraceae bacterium]
MTWPWLDKGFTSDRHRWSGDAHRDRRALHDVERYTTTEFRAETAGLGVIGLVHAHAATAADPAHETAWLGELGDRLGWPSAIIARAELASPGCVDLLRRHRAASPRCSSVRDMGGPDGLDLDACAAALDVATELQFAVEVRAAPERFAMFDELAQRWPEVNFVLSHASLPIERTPSTLRLWRDAALRLAEHPNWYCKVSALCGGSDPDWTVESIRPGALGCVETFG